MQVYHGSYIADKDTDLYLKPRTEIYEMLKKEIDK
jgi:hypothetical protein